jgi:uncharacterized protein involved in response to NO
MPHVPLFPIPEPELSMQSKPVLDRYPVLRLGFRPFYLLAATFAAVSIPLWISSYLGLRVGDPYVTVYWHMHEMVFGFVLAVVIGFLYTAGRNWSGLWTPRGQHLAALAALWIAGRIAMLLAAPSIAAIVDWLFIPCAAWPLYQVLKQSGNNKNLFLVGLLSLLALTNALFHAAVLGLIALSPSLLIQAAILVVMLIETAIAGRVIPGFTANTALGSKPIINPILDRIGFGMIALAGIAWVSAFPPEVIALLAGLAGCAQLARLIGWKPHRTLHEPLLWILHLSYAWVPIGLFLLALAALNLVSSSVAFHAIAVGSMAGMIIGMMTRTALGHTGRPLKAGRGETAMYFLIQSGALARLFAAIGPIGSRDGLLVLAAMCWSAGFLLYLLVYGPYLFHARIDGNAG